MADFFDKVVSGFNKGVATVSTGSKTMIEKTKINSVIKNLENEKKQLAEIIGVKVYQMYMSNSENDIPVSEVSDTCQQILAINQQIEEQNFKIAELDAEMEQVKASGGAPASAVNVSVTCQCGHPNVAGAKFCAKCGNQLF